MGKRHENRGVSQDTPLTFCGDSPFRAGLYIGEPHFLAGHVHRWRNTLSREAVCNCPPFTGHSASEIVPFCQSAAQNANINSAINLRARRFSNGGRADYVSWLKVKYWGEGKERKKSVIK